MAIKYYSSTMVMEWQELLQALKEDATHFHIVYREYKIMGNDSKVRYLCFYYSLNLIEYLLPFVLM